MHAERQQRKDASSRRQSPIEFPMAAQTNHSDTDRASLPPLSIFRGSIMATIVTVHGTGATGEESGPKWWQKTSACEMKLREFVQGSDGPLKYEQLVWDGSN